MPIVDATAQDGPDQTDPIVFLWHNNVQERHSATSASFGAFGKVYKLIHVQHEKGFELLLVRVSEYADIIELDFIIRHKPLGPDLARQGWSISGEYEECQAVECWDHDQIRHLGLKDSMVLGVAIYPDNVDKRFVPPKTVTSTFLHQAEGCATPCQFIHQMPMLEHGIFPDLLGNLAYSDVTFIVEDQEIPAHGTVLRNARAGRYFAGLLAHPFKEKTDGKVHIDG
ncbi:hypothetical protein HK104_009596 [Borealophlyctis nickersoniae]|nr:hypothetical protein HK104_009596 [Borealophlyctis nickersoniae]